jgi:hypothetical protein
MTAAMPGHETPDDTALTRVAAFVNAWTAHPDDLPDMIDEVADTKLTITDLRELLAELVNRQVSEGKMTINQARTAFGLKPFDASPDAWPNPDPEIVNAAWRELAPAEVRRDLAVRQVRRELED